MCSWRSSRAHHILDTLTPEPGDVFWSVAIDSMHDSYTSLGGLMAIFNMQLGEVAPGGVSSGLYGMLILAVVTVFVAGLMVGRTPEYLGKKITPREMNLATGYFLTTGGARTSLHWGPRWRSRAHEPAWPTADRTVCRRCYVRSLRAVNRPVRLSP